MDVVKSYDFAISNNLTQMVKFPTWITECDSHSPAQLISSDPSICSTVAFPPLRNSDDVVVLLSIDFPSNWKGAAPSHSTAYDNSCVDWDGLCDYFQDVPWHDIFKLSASAVTAEFCECFQVGMEVDIPHRKYQVKPHSAPWFQLLVLLP